MGNQSSPALIILSFKIRILSNRYCDEMNFLLILGARSQTSSILEKLSELTGVEQELRVKKEKLAQVDHELKSIHAVAQRYFKTVMVSG